MKAKSFIIILAAILLTACSGYKPGHMDLNGDCMVERIVFNDSLPGVVDLANREVVVWIPEVYEAKANMKVTALELSEGATSDIHLGDELCMTTTQKMRVENGNVAIDWTLYTVNREAEIESFFAGGFKGIVDARKREISVFVPGSANIGALETDIILSRGAEVYPKSGVVTNFSSPVTYTVTNGATKHEYVVKVYQIDKPKALYVGLAAAMTDLHEEEYTACLWMMTNVPQSLYASWDEIRSGKISLDECKVIWWHLHKDGGLNGKELFEKEAAPAVAAVPVLQQYLDNGGSLLLTRYATNLPYALSIGGTVHGLVPNNCWGGVEYDAEVTGGPWSWHTDSVNHPLYTGLTDLNDGEVYTCDAGYRITNSTAQWHIGTDWGGVTSHDDFRAQLGASILGYGGDKAVTVWEWRKSATQGGILCIGSGAYDWYSVDEVYTGYHKNVETMTLNAFNYLSK